MGGSGRRRARCCLGFGKRPGATVAARGRVEGQLEEVLEQVVQRAVHLVGAPIKKVHVVGAVFLFAVVFDGAVLFSSFGQIGVGPVEALVAERQTTAGDRADLPARVAELEVSVLFQIQVGAREAVEATVPFLLPLLATEEGQGPHGELPRFRGPAVLGATTPVQRVGHDGPVPSPAPTGPVVLGLQLLVPSSCDCHHRIYWLVVGGGEEQIQKWEGHGMVAKQKSFKNKEIQKRLANVIFKLKFVI